MSGAAFERWSCLIFKRDEDPQNVSDDHCGFHENCALIIAKLCKGAVVVLNNKANIKLSNKSPRGVWDGWGGWTERKVTGWGGQETLPWTSNAWKSAW